MFCDALLAGLEANTALKTGLEGKVVLKTGLVGKVVLKTGLEGEVALKTGLVDRFVGVVDTVVASVVFKYPVTESRQISIGCRSYE